MMEREQPIDSPDQPAPHAAAQTVEEEPREWFDEPEELPRRPRRRLLAPVPLTLIAVLLTACGFIGGVLVEKGQSSGTGTASAAGGSRSARLAALFGGAASSGGAAGAGGAPGGFSGAGRPVAGTVAYLDGDTIYVTTSEGNTVRVDTTPATSVSKSVKSSVHTIHPGETVTVRGAAGSSGAVSAESITVGSSAGSGFAALLGSSTTSSSTGSSSSSSGAAAGPSLFGGG